MAEIKSTAKVVVIGGGIGGGIGAGWNGGLQGGWQSGNQGTVPWNNNNGGYYGGGNGRWGGNGSVNGGNFWAVQNSHAQNRQAAGVGSYYQQAALQNQVQQANYNASNSGSYYSPGYSPGNMGYQINGGVNFGWQ